MSFSWQNNSNTSSKKFSWQTGSLEPTLTEKVNTEKQELRKKDLPVSVRGDRAKPTAAGGFVRDVVKTPLNVASNLLGGADLSNKYTGKVEGLGKIDITKAPWEKGNLKTVKKSVGAGLELGSYLGAGGTVKNVAKNVFKQPLKQFIKTEGVKLAKEGATQGLAYSLGTQTQENANTGKKISLTQTLKDTAMGAIIAPIAGAGINKVFGKKAAQVVEKKINPIINKVDNIADNALSKNTTGIKEGTTNFLKENPEEIANREVRLREVDGKVVIEDGRHTLQAAKETGITPIFKDVTSEYTGKPSEMIKDIIQTSKKEVTPTTVASEAVSELPSSIQRVEVAPKSLANDVEEMTKNIEGFDEGTFKQWSQDLRSIPKDELRNVALGGEKTIQNTIPKTAYYATLKNIAKETNDIELSQMLVNSPLRSKSGQEQVALKMATKDNLVDDLIDIKKVRQKQIGLSDPRYEAEAQTLFNKIKTKIETMKQQIPTIQEVEDIIGNVLICK